MFGLVASAQNVEVVALLENCKDVEITKSVPQVLEMADLVDYQEGSVVGRTILDKKAESITLFAFDQGEGLSEHTAPYDALVYMMDGTAEVRIEGKQFLLKKGEFVVMPANKPHAVRAVERFKMILIMVHA